MNGRKLTIFLILLIIAAAQIAGAQQLRPPVPARAGFPPNEDDSQPAVYYRLDFLIREMDGEKLVDTRNYSLWVQSGIFERMNAGSEVPYSTGSDIKYKSVGVSIGCRIREDSHSPQLELQMTISDALPPEKDSGKTAFRNVTLSSKALLSLNEPTTVSIVDDPASGHRFQVDVTATKLE
jgi:hypothetical protein